METLTADSVKKFLCDNQVPVLIEKGAAILRFPVPEDALPVLSSSSLSSHVSSSDLNSGSQYSHNSGLSWRVRPNTRQVMTGVPRELTTAPPILPAVELPFDDMLLPPGLPLERRRGNRGSREGEQPATGTGSKSALETINERPQHQKPPRKDQGKGAQDVGSPPREGKAKINALARMFSALRR